VVLRSPIGLFFSRATDDPWRERLWRHESVAPVFIRSLALVAVHRRFWRGSDPVGEFSSPETRRRFRLRELRQL
jgi:hypothetical protein